MTLRVTEEEGQCRTCVYEHKSVEGIPPKCGTRVRSGAVRVCVAAVARAEGAALLLCYSLGRLLIKAGLGQGLAIIIWFADWFPVGSCLFKPCATTTDYGTL